MEAILEKCFIWSFPGQLVDLETAEATSKAGKVGESLNLMVPLFFHLHNDKS